MGLLKRHRLAPDVADDLRRELGAHIRVLAWGQGEQQWAIGTLDELIVGTPGAWERFGWHCIARGGWDGPESILRWTTYQQGRHEIHLVDPGRLPELFNERVQATIVVEERIRIPGRSEEGIVIAGRREPSTGHVDWHVSLLKGTTWRTPGARETAEVMVQRLQAEYEGG